MVPQTSEKGETVCGSLILDCVEEALSDSQVELKNRAMNEVKDFEKKIATCVMPKLLEQQKARMPSMVSVSSPLQAINNTTTSPSFMIQAQTTPGGVANSSYVVVDQNQLKLLMATVNSPTPSRATTTVSSAQIQAQFTPRGMINIPPRTKFPPAKGSKITVTAPSTVENQIKNLVATVQPSSSPQQAPHTIQPSLPASNAHTIKLPALSPSPPWLKTPTAPVKTTPAPPPVISIPPAPPAPSHTPAPASKKADVVDLTDDGEIAPEETQSAVTPSQPSESSSTKRGQSERTFPSLVVTARVSLNSRNISASVSNRERTDLDSRIRRVLALSASVFTEHLLQQRLLRCDQVCSVHGTNLKLGMYSDASRFPFSGGYVWISECCPTNFVSVFTGSIFEGAPHSPTMILKLIYHWACQTSVQNVMQWVKVDSVYLKTFYTYLRAVCTAAVHEKYPLMGGFKKTIEVGVISLGTTSNDGAMKEVKLDVLGVLDTENRRLRLKAMDHIAVDSKLPASELEKYLKRKSLRIIEPLEQWVHPESTIVTDFTIDRNLCNAMGFKHIVQGHSNGPSNNMIMDYLRTVIPRMFQNTLSLLSRQIIQQFLDELVWRETWAPIPSRAYDKITEHIAEQTKLETGSTLVNRLSKIALNPSRNWKYAYWQANCKSGVQTSALANALTNRPVNDIAVNKRPNSVVISTKSKVPNHAVARPSPKSVAMARAAAQASRPVIAPPPMTTPAPQPGIAEIALEPYYYGTVEGDPELDTPTPFAFIIECIICKKDFSSNLAFSNHLIHHAINEQVSLSNPSLASICRFCLKPTPMLIVHMREYHKVGKHVPTCKICYKTFKTKEELINHMSVTHVELDMPYYCEACGFRTSIYSNMITHFESAHKKDSCIQCPFCLKIVYVTTRNGAEMSRNQLFFVQHVQRHLLPRQAKKCEKCALSFTNLPSLVHHQENFHSSCRDVEGVERYADEDEFILMAAPLVDPAPPASLSLLEINSKIQPPPIKTDPSLSNFNCAECDGPINSPGHFTAKVSCNKCKYQTYCAYAIKEHSARLHTTSTSANQIGRRAIVGKPSSMEKAHYCSACLFTTTNGNTMAKHMLQCGLAPCVPDKRKAEEMAGFNSLDQSLAKRQKAASMSRTKSKPKKKSPDLSDDGARFTGWEMTEDVA